MYNLPIHLNLVFQSAIVVDDGFGHIQHFTYKNEH